MTRGISLSRSDDEDEAVRSPLGECEHVAQQMLFFVFCRLLCILEGIRCEEERIIIIARVCCVLVEFYEGDEEDLKNTRDRSDQIISLSLSLSNSVLFNPPGQVEVAVLVGDVVTLVSVERALALEDQVSRAVRGAFPRGSPTGVFAQRRVVAFDQVFEGFEVVVLCRVFNREGAVIDFTREYFLV